jgi:hypothetical protein
LLAPSWLSLESGAGFAYICEPLDARLRRVPRIPVNLILALSVMGKPKEPELHPDAWARFERAVHVVAKSPPQHRKKPSRKQKARVKRNEEKIR